MTTTTFGIRSSGAAQGMAALLLAACWLAGPGAQAAPTLPQVVNGQATFNQQGNVFSITNTPGTIINWQSFNIGAGEITRFIQQGSDSAVLNRIVGQDPTKILGALQSNGKVFLINPNGILFGQGSRVDVNGLVASTLNMSDADFLAGKKNFQAGSHAQARCATTAPSPRPPAARYSWSRRTSRTRASSRPRTAKWCWRPAAACSWSIRTTRTCRWWSRPRPTRRSTWARSSPRAAASASSAPW
jgi:filamentous hemagglutinin family protein